MSSQVDCKPFRSSFDGKWDAMVSKCAKCVLRLLEIAKGRRRNYILDQVRLLCLVYLKKRNKKEKQFPWGSTLISGTIEIAIPIMFDVVCRTDWMFGEVIHCYFILSVRSRIPLFTVLYVWWFDYCIVYVICVIPYTFMCILCVY